MQTYIDDRSDLHRALLSDVHVEYANSRASALLILAHEQSLFQSGVGGTDITLFAFVLVDGSVAGPLWSGISDGAVVKLGLVGPAVSSSSLASLGVLSVWPSCWLGIRQD